MHYLRRTLQVHSSALIQTPLVPTSQMTPASRLVEPTEDGDMGMGIHQAQAQEDDSTELDFHSAEIPKRKVSTS